jgi:hypothetical protein
MRIGRSFLVSLRGLLVLVGLAIGFAWPNPFLLRILKSWSARTLLLAIVTFATLLFSGCANGGYISTSDQQQNTFGVGGVPPDSAFVDFTKDPRSQTGPSYPLYDGIGTP